VTTSAAAPAPNEAVKICAPRAINTEEEPTDGIYSPPPIKQDEPAADQSYSPRPIKRARRTTAAIKGIRDAIVELREGSSPQTVRQVCYAPTVRGLIGFTGIAQAIDHWAKAYRRDLRAVWCEKDALTGVLFEEVDVYDVPLMPAHGYSSLTFLHSAAKTLEAYAKPARIYHFGDLDPSGQDAAHDIEAKLRCYAPEAKIHFTRVAVTRQQVDEWNFTKCRLRQRTLVQRSGKAIQSN
jgi:hypothetical protein